MYQKLAYGRCYDYKVCICRAGILILGKGVGNKCLSQVEMLKKHLERKRGVKSSTIWDQTCRSGSS